MKKEQDFNNKPNKPYNGNGCKENCFLEIQYVYLSKLMLEGVQYLYDEHRKRKEA